MWEARIRFWACRRLPGTYRQTMRLSPGKWASNCQINRAVVVAMPLMYMVQMARDEVVGMITVGDSFMSAAAAMLVTAIMTAAGVSAAALRRILGIHVELVFIHMVAMHKVHVPIVKETLMPIVL